MQIGFTSNIRFVTQKEFNHLIEKDKKLKQKEVGEPYDIESAKTGEKLFSTTQTCEGEIAFFCSGEHGFGYDPIFYLPKKNATMAELTMEEKNKLSHRSKAFKKAVEWLLRG